MMHDDLECSVNVIEYSFPVHSTSFYMCVSCLLLLPRLPVPFTRYRHEYILLREERMGERLFL
jgi:hypothetical protein